MTNIDNFWNANKTGTVIISSYRAGTHFLSNNLLAHIRKTKPVRNLDEVSDTQFLTATYNSYAIAILNSVVPKIYLVGNQEQFAQWHTVQLTRKNKVNHWISDYLWKYYNTLEQRFNSTNLPHHGGSPEQYAHIKRVDFDINIIGGWLLEHHIVNLFQTDVSIDYDELKHIAGTTINWSPNNYGLTLEDLFVNHREISEYLTQTVPNVNKK